MSRTQLTLRVGAAAIALVTGYEGLRQTGYLDPVNIPTACYGHTKWAVVGQFYTMDECSRLLEADLEIAASAVRQQVRVPIQQPTFDALVSFTFNVGQGNLATSTLLKKLNAGDIAGACRELPKWVYAKGRLLRGLVKRRAAEMAVCLKGA